MITLGEFAGGDRTADARKECAELHDAVAPRKPLLRQQFGQQPVFRRAKEGALGADQKHSRAFHRQAAHGEADDEKCHHSDFKEFCADSHAALAVTIGEVAARHREKDERNREQRADDGHETVAPRLREVHADNQVNDEVLQPVVVEARLKLRDDEAPETAAPVAGRLRFALGRVC